MNSKTADKNKKLSEQLAEEMLNRIEQKDILPWKKPWVSVDLPGNFLNKSKLSYENKGYSPYSGINGFICDLYVQARGYKYPYFMTYKGFQKICQEYDLEFPDLRGNWIMIRVFSPVKDDDSGKKRGYYSVRKVANISHFSAEAIEKLKPHFKCLSDRFKHKESLNEVEQLLFGYLKREKIELQHGGSKAFYSPSGDYIRMPARSNFQNLEDYYATLAHECAHSTGHKNRLDRKFGARMGDHSYSEEELVAEYTAWRIMRGFQYDMPCSASYIQGWASEIKANKGLIMKAFTNADKARSMITG